MLNIAERLRKIGRLRPIRADFSENGRGQIRDHEYNSVEEICWKWEQRNRVVVKEERVKDYCICFCVFFHLKDTIYVFS